jgi:hypothetical protein
MALYEVTYSTKAISDHGLSFSDVVLVEADTFEELALKVVNIIHHLGSPGLYSVDSIAGNPYEPRSKKLVTKKKTKEYQNIVGTINNLIESRDSHKQKTT